MTYEGIHVLSPEGEYSLLSTTSTSRACGLPARAGAAAVDRQTSRIAARKASASLALRKSAQFGSEVHSNDGIPSAASVVETMASRRGPDAAEDAAPHQVFFEVANLFAPRIVAGVLRQTLRRNVRRAADGATPRAVS